MAQPARTTHPLDVLQSMINGILIETGKALRSSNNSRITLAVPRASENFHQALDDLESDIIRAKSVFIRDLNETRQKRIAAETPKPIVAEEIQEIVGEEDKESVTHITEEAQLPKELSPPEPAKAPENTTIKESNASTQETLKPAILETTEAPKAQQGPTPPKSSNEQNSNPGAGGLGIDTEVATATSAPTTTDLPNSSIDSLFDMGENEHNTADSELNFESMDYSNVQTSQNDFDLSSFGNHSHDFPNLETDFHAPDNNTANKASEESKKSEEDIFNNTGNDAITNNNLDLDLDLGTAGGDDSVFDDMLFFDGGNDGGMGGNGEMEHGEFDEAFFGID